MAYPSILSVISNPQATDRLNSPSHSSIHQAENTAISEIETFVGTLSSTVGTLVYDIRAAASNGGGHVQAANTGGTGITSYTKGDLLVATSSSVLTKLAISSTVGQVLTTDSNQAAGVKWAPGAASTKIDAQVTGVSKQGGNASILTTFYAGSILGSTLGTNNAVRYTMDFPTFNFVGSVYGQIVYGPNVINSFVVPAAASSVAGTMTIEGFILGNSSVAAQSGRVRGRISTPLLWGGPLTGAAESGFLDIYTAGTSSVESSANQNLLIQLQTAGTIPAGNVNLIGGICVVEQIK